MKHRLKLIIIILIMSLSAASHINAKNLNRKYSEINLPTHEAVFISGAIPSLKILVDNNIHIDQNGLSYIQLFIQEDSSANQAEKTNSQSMILSAYHIAGSSYEWLSNVSFAYNSKNINSPIYLNISSISSLNNIELRLRNSSGNLLNTYQLSLDSSNPNPNNSFDLENDFIEDAISKIIINSNQKVASHTLGQDSFKLNFPGKQSKKSNFKFNVDSLSIDEDLNLVGSEVNNSNSIDIPNICTKIKNINEDIIIIGTQGPAGAAGAKGPDGPAGPAGAAGAAGIAGAGAFTSAANIMSNSLGDYANDDFVFGSPSLDDDGDADHDSRMFFDKSKATFFAGSVDDTEIDTANYAGNMAIFGANHDFSQAGTKREMLVAGLNNIIRTDRTIISGENLTTTNSELLNIGSNSTTGFRGLNIGHNNLGSTSNTTIGRFLNNGGIASEFYLGRGNSDGDKMNVNSGLGFMMGINSNLPTIWYNGGNTSIGGIAPVQKLNIHGYMRYEPQSSPPAGAGNGDIYYDDSDALCGFVNGSWSVLAGGGACS